MISNKPLLATACSRARTAAFKLALDSASLNRGLGSMGVPVLGGGFNHGGRAFMFLLSALAFGGIFGCALGTVTRHTLVPRRGCFWRRRKDTSGTTTTVTAKTPLVLP